MARMAGLQRGKKAEMSAASLRLAAGRGSPAHPPTEALLRCWSSPRKASAGRQDEKSHSRADRPHDRWRRARSGNCQPRLHQRPSRRYWN